MVAKCKRMVNPVYPAHTSKFEFDTKSTEALVVGQIPEPKHKVGAVESSK